MTTVFSFKLIARIAILLAIIGFLLYCGLVGFLLLYAEALAREHLPRVQQAVDAQCSERIEV